MEKEPNNAETSTSNKRSELNRFRGSDFCTFANALREAATEIKGQCLGYKYTSSPDFEAFLLRTDEFLDAALETWKAIRQAIKDDNGSLGVYKMLDDHRI